MRRSLKLCLLDLQASQIESIQRHQDRSNSPVAAGRRSPPASISSSAAAVVVAVEGVDVNANSHLVHNQRVCVRERAKVREL